MSQWLEQVTADLQRIYARIPEVHCKGLCDEACGPIDMGPVERLNLRRAGFKLPPRDEQLAIAHREGHYRCPVLQGPDGDGRCGAYEARPTICRLWGAFEALRCPYGCLPDDGRLLTNAEAVALIDASMKAGTPQEPRPVEEFAALEANHPQRELYQALLDASLPTATHPRAKQYPQQDSNLRSPRP